jgi:hypothetical protein
MQQSAAMTPPLHMQSQKSCLTMHDGYMHPNIWIEQPAPIIISKSLHWCTPEPSPLTSLIGHAY